MDLKQIFSSEYAKQNLPRALVAGAILGFGFRMTLQGQTYTDVKDQVDDFTTYMLADNFKDILGAVMPVGDGASTALAMFLPARMKLGNYVADRLIVTPAGVADTEQVDPTVLNVAAIAVGAIAAIAVYVSGDMIDAAVGKADSAIRSRIAATF